MRLEDTFGKSEKEKTEDLKKALNAVLLLSTQIKTHHTKPSKILLSHQ